MTDDELNGVEYYNRLYEQRYNNIKQIINRYFDNPCNTCECVAMDGNCEIYRGKTCAYDLHDDIIESMVSEIIEVIM